ncbi:uncharacterized protein N7469_000736 [Penicillium citrinum]|uniref:Uncharacterized protein n=1 Tax=Penicillium citrinum TaxID=5077 RepID=A0A9W9TVP4_PENCI|nr:uncharacterized protein N7469_000736 [Penicillium citrinum]KAJ5242409.1 hypothetical protein N7469_000736 [Penicillium citrinum]KAK5806932.1 hypothetical protein VI817_001190 [Penicillium citrinum]
MRFLPRGLGNSQSRFIILFLLVLTITAQVSAQRAGDTKSDTTAEAAQTTDDRSTSDSTPSVTETTAATTAESTSSSSSDKTTKTSSSSSSSSTKSEKTTSMETTTSSSSTSSESTTSTSDSTSTTSVSTTTTSSSSTSSSTTTAAPIVTVPPTANAPYMQTTNTPEGTVFIAVGALLGLIGLAVLAWRGMVAWSVNRSVRRAAMAQSESKRLLRGSRKKRSGGTYAPAPATDVSLEKLGAATRASYKPSKRTPSGSSGLFYSPTAGGAGSHHSLNATNNRGSTYLPPGFYTAAGTHSRDSIGGGHAQYTSPTGYPPSSPSLPPTGTYHDASHNPRHSYVGASTSSLNLSQPQQGRAPSAYLEDLFENHTPPPRRSDRRDGRH